jgi:hypothetical protein
LLQADRIGVLVDIQNLDQTVFVHDHAFFLVVNRGKETDDALFFNLLEFEHQRMEPWTKKIGHVDRNYWCVSRIDDEDYMLRCISCEHIFRIDIRELLRTITDIRDICESLFFFSLIFFSLIFEISLKISIFLPSFFIDIFKDKAIELLAT